MKIDLLLEEIASISSQKSELEFRANPFFKLVKPTEENLAKYDRLFSKNRNFTFVILILIFLIKSITSFFLTVFGSMISFISNFNFNRFPKSQIDTLFISHFTGESVALNFDSLFGGLPLEISKDIDEVGFFYLNGTRKSCYLIYSKHMRLDTTP